MLLKVRVMPNSRKVQVEELGENHLRVRVIAPPIGGQANRELIETLARYYKTPKQSVEIKKGLHSRNKIVEVKD
jgi:uncharacterized protein (TIGR00251 family)